MEHLKLKHLHQLQLLFLANSKPNSEIFNDLSQTKSLNGIFLEEKNVEVARNLNEA